MSMLRRSRYQANDAETGVMLFCAWVILGLVVLLAVATLAPEKSRPVLIPLTSALVIAAGFFLGIARRHQWAAPIFHIGSFYGAVVLIYTLYPLVVYLYNDLSYHPLSDIRMYIAQPEPGQIATLAWWYVAYLGTFCLVYFVLSRSAGSLRIEQPALPGSLLFVVILIYLVVQVYLLTLTRFLGTGPATSYMETYLALRHLPLIVQQVTGRLQSWVQVLEIVLLVILFTDFRRNRFYIALILLWVAASTFMKMHARTELFLLLAAAGFLWHHMVRRMRLVTVVVGGITLLALFSVLGALRNIGESEIQLREMMTGSSEFESILGNAHDLLFVRNDSGVFLEDPTLYFADFILPIPSQLLPFTKQIASYWYLDRYYPSFGESGGGFAFGAIAEGVVGFGLIEVFVRATLLALLFAWIDRRFTAWPISVWAASFYVWLAVMSYTSFRMTSFTLITAGLQLFAVPILLLQLSFALWIRFASRTRRSNSAPAAPRLA